MAISPIGAERVSLARQHDRHCLLCAHRCGVDRAGGQRGPCQAGAEANVYRSRIEYGEELELVPSHLLYLSGCNLSCAFCIGEQSAMDPGVGRPLSGPWLSETIDWGRRQGAANLQWVGGEPTIHIPSILGALAECGVLPPLVWKSNFYQSGEAAALLDGIVDVYVADFKFGNDRCAKRIAGVTAYLETVTQNLLSTAPRARLIVRHLLLPGHFDCCYRPVVEWMRTWLPAVPLSIRDGYLPRWRADRFGELGGFLDRETGKRAHALARERGITVIT
jgi:putative pyruvate formate lyase activating enzyme